jgi:hypothetical protein
MPPELPPLLATNTICHLIHFNDHLSTLSIIGDRSLFIPGVGIESVEEKRKNSVNVLLPNLNIGQNNVYPTQVLLYFIIMKHTRLW